MKNPLLIRVFQLPVRFYRIFISPMLGQNCRFYPSCSAYALEALEKHGVLGGSALAVKRICKCHPFYKGDFLDPVPDAGYKRRAKDK